MASTNWAELMAKAEAPAGGSGKVFPKGRYRVQVMKTKTGTNNGGKEKLSVMFKVVEGQSEAGEILWTSLYVSPENPVALGIFFQQFERLGGSLQILEMGGSLEQASQPMLGKIVDIDIDHDEWPKHQDPPVFRNKIIRYTPVLEGSPLPATPSVSAIEATAKASGKKSGLVVPF